MFKLSFVQLCLMEVDISKEKLFKLSHYHHPTACQAWNASVISRHFFIYFLVKIKHAKTSKIFSVW